MQRDAHLERLDRLTGLLAIMSRTVVIAIRYASKALLEADARAAQAALDEHAAICRLHQQIEDDIPVVLTRLQPVASDLRLVLAALRMNGDMMRMGALARHVATIASANLPGGAVPAAAAPILATMASSAAAMAEKSAVVLATRDPIDAMQLGLDDDVTDALVRDLFLLITGDDWTYGTRAAIDLAMLGRFYERYADHAVSIAEQVVYVVTGETRAVPF
jgi:phosphate transport system protein